MVTPFTGNWEEIRRHCLQILQPCILQDKDAILPAISGLSPGETFVIVASTDEHGAKVVENRIQEQLERSQRLTSSCAFKVVSTGIKLPVQDGQEPVEKLVQKVADSITEMTMAAFGRRQSSAH